MAAKKLLWYLSLIAAVGLLIYAFLARDVRLSLAAFALAYVLKKTNKYVAIPRFYQNKGVRNDLFEGKGRK
ncbi:MAG: hypothetical protein LBJ61_05065 [Deltaproteobacteria bacterium]|jgi:hypothetical protein|nr:hypothetical protein [Deltaproteobacteria bacterium]